MGMPYRKNGERNLKKILSKIKTLEQWKARAATIRKGILVGAELYPLPKRTPLNVVIHGKRESQGYSIENVYFESLPGLFVTGNLYQPLGENAHSPTPVILKAHGHFDEGRLKPDREYYARVHRVPPTPNKRFNR